MNKEELFWFEKEENDKVLHGVKVSGMPEQNIKAFKDGLEKLGCTQIEFYQNGIKFDFQGEIRKETYQQCMVYILNGIGA